MAGINFLYDSYKEDPSEVEKLLDSKIEISEKLSGSRFAISKEPDGSFKYYKRGNEVTRVDRTLAKYYEKAINHFETLGEDKRTAIPDFWKFGFEYFPNLQPVKISYDRMPLNGLVLTDISAKDPKGKVLEIIVDEKTLKEYADILEVEAPPILFEGQLKRGQKRRILEFLNTPFEMLAKRFKTESFTKFILGIISPDLKKSFMQDDLDKEIEGLVFRFDGSTPFKIVDPTAYMTKSNDASENKPSDIYNLTLVMLQEFFLTLEFERIKLRENDFDDRYIEFISQVFNMFTKTRAYTNNFAGGVDFELPKFLTREEAKLNFDFVKNPETLALLKKSSTNQELFKIMLASMRSKKRRPSGYFTKELVKHHNKLVEKIEDYVNVGISENVLTSFSSFKAIYLSESENWEEYGFKENDTLNESMPTFHETNKAQEYDKAYNAIATLKKTYNVPATIAETKDSISVCLVAGKFQPFHNGHLSMLKDIKETHGVKSFIVLKRNMMNRFNEELSTSMMNEICGKYGDFIEGYGFADGHSLHEISRAVPTDFNIKYFSGTEDECNEISFQNEGVEAFPSTQYISGKDVLDKIDREDIKGFRNSVPKCLHTYYYKFKNEMAKA